MQWNCCPRANQVCRGPYVCSVLRAGQWPRGPYADIISCLGSELRVAASVAAAGSFIGSFICIFICVFSRKFSYQCSAPVQSLAFSTGRFFFSSEFLNSDDEIAAFLLFFFFVFWIYWFNWLSLWFNYWSIRLLIDWFNWLILTFLVNSWLMNYLEYFFLNRIIN